MQRSLRTALILLGLVPLCALASVLATLLLSPLWSWFEATTGIESLGHSGPSDWCYVAVFLLLMGIATWLCLRRR